MLFLDLLVVFVPKFLNKRLVALDLFFEGSGEPTFQVLWLELLNHHKFLVVVQTRRIDAFLR